MQADPINADLLASRLDVPADVRRGFAIAKARVASYIGSMEGPRRSRLLIRRI
jgi:hypothetical protein